MCCRDMLLLGAIRRYMFSGIAVASPVGTSAISPGLIVCWLNAVTSNPIDPFVACLGTVAWLNTFLIYTVSWHRLYADLGKNFAFDCGISLIVDVVFKYLFLLKNIFLFEIFVIII